MRESLERQLSSKSLDWNRLWKQDKRTASTSNSRDYWDRRAPSFANRFEALERPSNDGADPEGLPTSAISCIVCFGLLRSVGFLGGIGGFVLFLHRLSLGLHGFGVVFLGRGIRFGRFFLLLRPFFWSFIFPLVMGVLVSGTLVSGAVGPAQLSQGQPSPARRLREPGSLVSWWLLWWSERRLAVNPGASRSWIACSVPLRAWTWLE